MFIIIEINKCFLTTGFYLFLPIGNWKCIAIPPVWYATNHYYHIQGT